MIKVEFTIKYYESYIPPRCRKPRYNEITESVFGIFVRLQWQM